MQKIKSSLPNMVGVLVGFSLLIGVILASVNQITEGPIKIKQEQTLAAGIKTVMQCQQISVAAPLEVTDTIDGKLSSFVIHACAGATGERLGAAVESSTNAFGGELKVLVGFDTNGYILGYTILASSETPGLGAKVDQWFQKDGKGNIIGKNPKGGSLTVSKDGGDIDAITASTITSRAFLKAINHAYRAYMKIDWAHEKVCFEPTNQ